MRKFFAVVSLIVPLLSFAGSSGAWAHTPLTNWLQDPATPLAREVRANFWTTLAIIAPFLLGAEGLLLYAVLKFRTKPGRKPATFHENFKLEVFWTALPAVALVLIAIPAFRTMQAMNVPPKSDLVVEVIGHQFFWEYRYPRYSITLAEEPLVVPVGKVVTLNCTSVDVIHSWFVPAFGVKQDANPGRITNAWFKADAPGTYRGQCAELCGKLHAQMYITVKVLLEDDFKQWLAKKVAAIPGPVGAPPPGTGSPNPDSGKAGVS